MLSIKLISALAILMITLLSGLYPFFKKMTTHKNFEFPIGEALACGVFLGAGLIHMLGDASTEFYQLHISYPVPFLLAGLTFLLLLFLEHIGQELHAEHGANSKSFAILSMILLSIHSFLAGAALGFSDSIAMTILILFAILAHKWAASFALAIQITKSTLLIRPGLILFTIFAIMAPLGILFGTVVTNTLGQYPLLAPIFSSLAAGTFLYLGSLHGLERAVLVKQCCRLNLFYYVIGGFVLMAVVAIWT